MRSGERGKACTWTPSTGIARWLRDVADPQMDRLRDPDRGPFVACGDRHLLPPPSPAPEGSWDGIAQNFRATAPQEHRRWRS